ncbi:MAG: hypothetical protein KAX45_01100 [Chitinophagaceae bacterium]|nr:hypothetical protein [Chitinophagaceae bacterium]MBP6588509.1 hypothetical protein [Chitinophagaceae bacterium]MBP8243107.1 hypothetical protein [Chitinophagaceae bacterium]
MTEKDNILQELKELNSRLAGYQSGQTYTVPAGYFDGLIGQVMQRIRALETANASEELELLSPVLSRLSKSMPYTVPTGYFEQLDKRLEKVMGSDEHTILDTVDKQMPYQVPAGYFDGLAERMLQAVRTADHSTVQDETAAISPLLGSLKKEMPFHVPAGYFESLASDVAAKESATEAKVIAITSRSWFRYAAAAVVTGVVFLAGFLLLNRQDNDAEAGIKVFSKVLIDIKPLNDTEQDDLVDFLDAGLTGSETAQVNPETKSKEIQQLLQDVSEEELKDFREQTEDVGEVLMTN